VPQSSIYQTATSKWPVSIRVLGPTPTPWSQTHLRQLILRTDPRALGRYPIMPMWSISNSAKSTKRVEMMVPNLLRCTEVPQVTVLRSCLQTPCIKETLGFQSWQKRKIKWWKCTAARVVVLPLCKVIRFPLEPLSTWPDAGLQIMKVRMKIRLFLKWAKIYSLKIVATGNQK
jgi:hypothetical protein